MYSGDNGADLAYRNSRGVISESQVLTAAVYARTIRAGQLPMKLYECANLFSKPQNV
jgi:hypothetical protein